TNTLTNQSSSGATVSSNVDNLSEGRLDDNDTTFSWLVSDPFNGATQGTTGDTTRGVVFDWTGSDRFYEWEVPSEARDFRQYLYLSFRAAQGTQHPNTLAVLGDLTFDVTLRDGQGVPATSTINVGATGGGIEQPYQRSGGWWNEMEVVRLRLTDFLNNGSGLDLGNVVAVRLDLGPSHGSNEGRLVVDELMLTSDQPTQPFEIVEPTTDLPAYAGTSVAGSRVLMRIVAPGGRDLSPANLRLFVDGVELTPAQIPTAAAEVGGETWVVIAPGPKADGCYDLRAELATPTGVSDEQTASLCYADDESRELDRVLAIDQTNSMNRDGSTGLSNGEKMDAARAAAKFFVDLSNPNDQVGVVSFQRRDEDSSGTIVEPAELAEVEFPLTLAGEGGTDQRPAARMAIDGVEPDPSPGFFGPETSPGAALVEARTMLTADGMAGHEPNVVLLTDGLENYAPYWNQPGAHGSPLRPGFVADDVRIDTIGIGGDADDALLIDVAEATGGEFRNLNEGSGSYFLLSRLSSWYKALDEDVRGEQRFFYREGFPPATTAPGGLFGADLSAVTQVSKYRYGQFVVEPALDWMTVAFHANVDNAAQVFLVEPGAATAVTAAPPAVTVRSDPKHSVYRIRTPQPGVWTYVVRAADLSAEFFAVASAPTLLVAHSGPVRVTDLGGGDHAVPMRVWVADTDAVAGAFVEGELRRPDGIKVPLTLRDDGTSADGGAGDGIYGFEYVASLPGPYHAELVARGTSNDGEPFERYLSIGFAVPGAGKKDPQFGEGRPPLVPEPPEGFDSFCGCEAERRWTLAGFSGVTLPTGAFDAVADSSTSLGIKPAFHFTAPPGRWSLGLYLGHDRFANVGAGGPFELTHLSGEIELAPWTDLCPSPAFHVGAGAYRDENGDTEAGWNAGASLGICLSRRVKLLTRVDYRTVDELERDYWTIQAGLRWGW
ncbi:MAG TPA: vWA domain-containing protein, partial [Thermoanaerobaculia bacterium]|nr:vWA domain-containing protein [Thermoanaerobaculia bacterium]